MKELTNEEIREKFGNTVPGGAAGAKAPSTKHQAPEKHQAPSSKGGGTADGAEGKERTELPRFEPIGNVVPTPDNPRRKIDEKSESFLELVASVRAHGILQSMIGRPHPSQPGRIDLRAGHRRLRAAAVAGLREVLITVREMDDRTAMEVTVCENMHREDLTPLEEARGVALLRDSGHNVEEMAARMGKTRAWVLKRAQLCSLTKEWQAFAEENGLHAAGLEMIARYSAGVQKELLDEFESDQWLAERCFGEEGALEQLRRHLGERMKELRHAPWKLEDALLHPEAGACAVCPKRSGCQQELFEEEMAKGGDRCLDAGCWGRKVAAYVSRREGELKEKFPVLVKVQGKGSRAQEEKGVLGAYTYDTVKKGTAGAVPALVVSGSNAGAQVWIETYGGAAAKKVVTAAAKQAAASLDPAASRALLKEKKEAHEKRRWAWVLKHLQELLDENELPVERNLRKAEGLVELVAAFGTGGSFEPYESEKKWKAVNEGEFKGIAGLQRVWERVRCEIRNTLQVFTVGEIGKRHHLAARGAAWILGLEVDDVKAEADAAIPEPKSWEQLEQLSKAPKAKAPSTKHQAPGKLQAPSSKGKAEEVASCRVCGCTEADCSECVEATGHPCHWVEEDLCSRCAGEAPVAKTKGKKGGKGK